MTHFKWLHPLWSSYKTVLTGSTLSDVHNEVLVIFILLFNTQNSTKCTNIHKALIPQHTHAHNNIHTLSLPRSYLRSKISINTEIQLTLPIHILLFMAIRAAWAAEWSANSTNAYGSFPGYNKKKNRHTD